MNSINLNYTDQFYWPTHGWFKIMAFKITYIFWDTVYIMKTLCLRYYTYYPQVNSHHIILLVYVFHCCGLFYEVLTRKPKQTFAPQPPNKNCPPITQSPNSQWSVKQQRSILSSPLGISKRLRICCTKERLHQLVLKNLCHVLPKSGVAADTFNAIFTARHDLPINRHRPKKVKKKKKRKQPNCCLTVSKGYWKWDHILFSVFFFFYPTYANSCI